MMNGTNSEYVSFSVPGQRLRWFNAELRNAGIAPIQHQRRGDDYVVTVDALDADIAQGVWSQVAEYSAGGRRAAQRRGAWVGIENAAGTALVVASWILAGAGLLLTQTVIAIGAMVAIMLVSTIWQIWRFRPRARRSRETVYATYPDLARRDAVLWAGAALLALFFAGAILIVALGGGL